MTPTTSTSPAPAAPPTGAPVEPTHGCARCGAPVGPGVGLCEQCNPIGLRDVAASQVHGTVIISVLVGFVILAILARLAVTGGGPYPASVDDVATSGTGLAVTLTVTNQGDGEGQTTCRLQDPEQLAGGTSAFVLTPRIAPESTTTFTSVVQEFGSTPLALIVECRLP
jgi:hypothetical protein